MRLARLQAVFQPLFISLALAACAPAPSRSPQWLALNAGLETHAPVLALASDPRDSNRVYAGAYDVPGMYRSLDRARTWQPFAEGLGHAAVFALQFIGGTLYAGTTNGLYRLSAERWTPIDAIPPVSVHSIARSADDVAFYLATDRRGIFATADANETWTRVPGLDDEIILSVAALDTQTIFAGTGGNGAFVTSDGGRNWRTLDLFTGDYVSLILLDPRDRKTIFLRTRWGLFRTRNLGANWEILQGGIERGVVNALLVAPPRIYAASSAGVLISDDDGASWRDASAGLPDNAQPLTLTQIDAQTILVGMQTGVYMTRDGGASWVAANRGLGAAVVHSLALKASGAIVAATEDGLYESDADRVFHPIGNAAMRVPMLSIAFAPSEPQRIYAGAYRRGIFISNNGGITWDSAGDIFRGRLAAPGLAVNPGDKDVIFTRVLFQRIYKSDDGGESWRAVWSGMSDDTQVETMVVAPSDPAIMFAGTNFGVFLSRDGGESWTPRGLSDSSSRWGSYRSVFAIWVDPRDPRRVLAGATDGLYQSDDLGETWTRAGLDHFTVTAIVRGARGTRYIGTKYQGVWMSRDDATGWERLGKGLDPVSVNALVVDEARGIVYAATTRGIFKTFLPPTHQDTKDTKK